MLEGLLITFMILLVFASLICLYGNWQAWQKTIVVTKPLLVPFIIGIHVAAHPLGDALIVMGLLFGWVGDILLLQKEKKRFFSAGLASFLAGHVVYILAFARTIEWTEFPPILFLAIIPYFIAGIGASKLVKNAPVRLKWPTRIYLMVIFIMSLFSCFLALSEPSLNLLAVLLGTIMFIISDGLLSIAIFNHKPARWHVSVMATYIIAQTLIGLFFPSPVMI
ncbi:hypothetical protein GF325_05650 [Candidatus Bathyarchaeota archaeon]|nr:hypothetical protein [Candidatus Bathyarchaeota archaeon]